MKCWGECGMEGTVTLVRNIAGGKSAAFCRYCAVTFTETGEWKSPDKEAIHALRVEKSTPREVLGPSTTWIRMAPGWYRHEETGYRVIRDRGLWHVYGGYWDGAAFGTLWAAQTHVEGAGRMGAYRD